MSASFGFIAAFADAEALTRAVSAARRAGWTRLDAFAPHPVPDAAEAMGVRATPVAWIALAAGVTGAVWAYGWSWYLSVHDYPLNVGGRPPHAWPAFLPAAYIIGVLAASLAAMLGMLWLNGLPRLHHPVFAARGFGRASDDRFFLLLLQDDPLSRDDGARRFLATQQPLSIVSVPDA